MDIQAFSVDDFCTSHSISRSKFYELMRQGEAPVTMRIGRRTFISQESAQAWRRRMERKAGVPGVEAVEG